MSEADTNYLKENVGDAVAAGLAAVAIAKPHDPVQFMGEFLLKYHTNAVMAVEKQDEAKKLEEERAEYEAKLERERLEKEEAERAAKEDRERIQRELEESYVHKADEYMDAWEAIDAELESKRQEQQENGLEDGEEPITALSKSQKRYNRVLDAIDGIENPKQVFTKELYLLDKAKLPKDLYKVVKAMLYVLDFRKAEIGGWDVCKKIFKDYTGLIHKLKDYDIVGVHGKRKFSRVARLFFHISEDNVKRFSFAAFLLYEWTRVAAQVYEDLGAHRKKLADEGDDNALADLEEEEDIIKEEEEETDDIEKDMAEVEFSDDEEPPLPESPEEAEASGGEESPYNSGADDDELSDEE